jgi:hypothetical protein
VRAWPAFTLAFVVASFVGRADSAARPFERLTLGLGAVSNVDRNQFHAYWDAARGVAVDASTPLYIGHATLLVRVAASDAAAGASVPDFTSVFVALGGRVGRSIMGALRADLGLSVGATEWIFSGDGEAALGNELELGTELGARVAYRFAMNWSAVVTGSYQITYTYEPIELVFVSIGVARTFGAPRWIRGVLE